jgi:hypothetical protein
MMPDPVRYQSWFTNRYGEAWQFEYDDQKQEGILCGSDVDGQRYVVIGGFARGLILNEEEIQWLRKAWAEATRHHERP